MPSYAVRLEVRADKALTSAQLEQLDGGRHAVVAAGKVRGRSLEVSLTMAGGDVVGALARALNVVLDVVPGEVRAAELVEQRPRPVARRRRR
ncbi:MAG TPA: hypothetical protein VGO78_05785 [Acidimicrobiales bacterium]|jgi:hypothetical protein|nr:hypothetical protein [Acidimicrobiales bacterium]